MPLLINLRHLENKDFSLEGEIPSEELGLEKIDELIHARKPLRYNLEAQRLENDLLVHGTLKLSLECECSRCLKRFPLKLNFDNWTCHLPLAGEEKVEVVNDSVDLTPYIREDILLAFPQHPLCENECSGLKNLPANGAKGSNGADQTNENSSAWAELDKLKL